MIKPSLIILGCDPAEPEQDIPSNATFTGNEYDDAGGWQHSAEDIKRELRRLISERTPTPLHDYPDPLNIAPTFTGNKHDDARDALHLAVNITNRLRHRAQANSATPAQQAITQESQPDAHSGVRGHHATAIIINDPFFFGEPQP